MAALNSDLNAETPLLASRKGSMQQRKPVGKNAAGGSNFSLNNESNIDEGGKKDSAVNLNSLMPNKDSITIIPEEKPAARGERDDGDDSSST